MPQPVSTLFWQHINNLLKAKLNLSDALSLLGQLDAHPSLSKLAQSLLTDLHHGHRLSFALRQHPAQFSAWQCDLIECAEQIDRLQASCQLIISYQQQQHHWRGQLHKALRYPLLVAAAAIAMCGYLLSEVVPQFAELFTQQGAKLPRYTQWLLACSQFPWHRLSAILLLCLLACYILAKRQPHTAANFYWHCPGIRRFYRHYMHVMWLQTLTLLLSAKVPLLPALQTLTQLATPPQLRSGFQRVTQQLVAGKPLEIALQQLPHLPALVLNWLTLAARSKTLQPLLKQISDQQHQELETQLQSLISWIEPVMMLGIGGLVAAILLALYLPILQIGAIF